MALNKFPYDLVFNQYARFMANSIKENEFFHGRSPQWIAYTILSELQNRYYGKRTPVLKKDLKKFLSIKSPVSNSFTSKNPRVIKFRRYFDECYEACKLKEEIGKEKSKSDQELI